MKKFYLILKIAISLLIIYRLAFPIFAEEISTGSEVLASDSGESSVYSVYQGYDGSINSTYSEYFKGVLLKNIMDDYVIARTSQYEYLLAYGDLNLSGGVFSGNVDTVIINTNTYGADFNISYGSDSSFILYPNNNMIYSNLGEYPSLLGGEILDIIEIFVCSVLLFDSSIARIFYFKRK